MTRRLRLAVPAAVGLLALAAVGCSDSNGTATGSTDQPAAAQVEFCDDLASHLAVLDRYGRIFTEDQATVGQLDTDAQELEAGRTQVERSASKLADAISAANTAATSVPGTAGTTTTVLTTLTADEHIEAISKAERELDRTIEGVDTDTLITDASAELHAAAFGLEQAYAALFLDAGCLAGNTTAAKAVRDYTTGLQHDLTTLGYYTDPVDGVYGPATVDAISSLQDQAGLPQTGVVDPQTEAALAEQLRDHGAQQALNVAALQGALTAAGFYTGPLDGVWTPAVEDALAAFQRDQSLPPTGAIDPATLAALLDLGSGSAEPSPSSTTSSTTSPSTTTAAAG
jgi:murein L,D-transpeptidase YcbB/YkuD